MTPTTPNTPIMPNPDPSDRGLKFYLNKYLLKMKLLKAEAKVVEDELLEVTDKAKKTKLRNIINKMD